MSDILGASQTISKYLGHNYGAPLSFNCKTIVSWPPRSAVSIRSIWLSASPP